uniref:Uncharacterized protein n=1 Tax=Acrobeloides nanus TaxID=290746 RepID=A0A914CJI7_9BILA
MFFAAGLCIVMQHVRLPVIVTTLTHYGWIMVSGDNPIFYFILNASLRKEVLDRVRKTMGKSSNKVIKVTPVPTK